MNKIGLIFALVAIISVTNARYSRIVGGNAALNIQFPYQISLQLGKRHTCGGAILNEEVILTAAHCVTWSDKSLVDFTSLKVRAGTNVIEIGGVLHDVKNVTVHEKYLSSLNDIALIQLSTPLTFTNAIQPIKISANPVQPGDSIIISGWGKTSDKGVRSEVLKYIPLIAISQKECARRTGLDFKQIICLGHDANQGACQGDSGGPAALNGELVGIASAVYISCGTTKPDVYANISYHTDWIESKMLLFK